MKHIIDCHCHIYPGKIAAHAAQAIGEFYKIDMEMDGTVSCMTAARAEAGITHSVIFSVATVPRQVSSINHFIAEQVTASNGTMTGLGALHPDSPTLAEDVEELISLGLRGVKLHPDFQKFRLDDPGYMRIYELCRGRLPVLLHTGDRRYDYSNPNRLIPVLKTFPDLKVIGAHFGGWSMWEEAARLLSGYENLWVDSSSSLYAMTPEAGTVCVHRYGAERVLFGVDSPMWLPSEELARFDRLDLTEEERERILWKNAAEMFSITL